MDLLIRLLVAIAVIWLTQTMLGALEVKEPARKIIFVVVVILAVLWLLGITLFIR